MDFSNAAENDDPILRALHRPVESRGMEFKESQPLDALKWRLVKTCMAMANLREGGYIVIGVSERNGRPEPLGMEPDHEVAYKQDTLYSLVNKYARPRVELSLRFVEYDGKRFVGIEIRAFDRIPVFCGVAMPEEAGKDRLSVGDIPCRTRDRISTSRVHDADLVSEILEVAAEKRAAEIIATAQRIGLQMPSDDRTRFSAERHSFGDFE